MTKPSTFNRREFISKVTGVAGGVATVAVSSSFVQASSTAEPKQKVIPNHKAKGYQQTEHIAKYYQLADL